MGSNLTVRTLAFLVFAAGVGAATYAAYQLYAPDVSLPEPPLAPSDTLAMEPEVPVAFPGRTLRLWGLVSNPDQVPQNVTFSAEPAGARVRPDHVTVGPLERRNTTITLEVPADAEGVVRVALNATYGGPTPPTTVAVDVPVVAEGSLLAVPLREQLIARAGETVSLPVVVAWNGDGERTLRITPTGADGAGVQSTATAVGSRSAVGTFLTFDAPEGLRAGTTIAFTVGAGDASSSFSVRLSPPVTTPVPKGAAVRVDYVGRLEDGALFDTSVADVAHGAFAKGPLFTLRPTYAPFELVAGPESNTIAGFWQTIQNMTVGETRTIRLAPQDAYGPATIDEPVPATTTVPRDDTSQRAFTDFPRAAFENPRSGVSLEGKGPGDTFNVTSGAAGATNTYQFQIQRIDEQSVDVLWLVEVGDVFSFFPMWPNATVVTEVSDDSFTFRTTPTTGPEDAFTWGDGSVHAHAPFWTDATTVDAVTDDSIALRHAPAVGLQYTYVDRSGQQQPRQYTVASVGPQTIVVRYTNPSPLGGHTLTFDITVLQVASGGAAGTTPDHEH